MNHTAHCFLSFRNPDVLLGNFIGDFVKGSRWQNYPTRVQRGILLHREIDSYTDNHSAVRTSVQRIRSYAGRYSAPVVDILYDHLLCLHWDQFSPVSFDAFADWVYNSLDARQDEMPPVLQRRWPYMVQGRFLHGYQTREGLQWVLQQFAKRLPPEFSADNLSSFFFDRLEEFSSDFKTFFPDLQARVQAFSAS